MPSDRTCPACGKLKAAAYARISDDQKGERLGVTDQVADCWARIAAEGWCTCTPEADTYQDNDIGAFRNKPRPGYEALLDALDAGTYRILVARESSRLIRNALDGRARTLIELVERHGLRVVTLWAGHWDLSTADGRKRVRDGFSDAQYEAERTGERVARARLRNAQKGASSPGGQRPWGWGVPRLDSAGQPILSPKSGATMIDKSQHNPEQAAEVRDVARRLLAGESLRSASLRYGKQPKDVKRALLAPRMIGVRAYHSNAVRKETPCTATMGCPGCLFTEDAWEPILDRDTYEAVRALLTSRNRDRIAGVAARKYLLTGFLYCGVCGSRCHGYRMTRGNRNNPTLKYACWPQGHVVRVVDRLDEHVRDQLLLRADVSLTAPQVDPALTGAVSAYETRLAEAKEMWKRGSLGSAEYEADKADLEARLLDARGRLADAVDAAEPSAPGIHVLRAKGGHTEMVRGEYGERRAWWEGADLRQRRVLLAEHVSRIVMNRNRVPRKFEPTAVDIFGVDGERWEILPVPARQISRRPSAELTTAVLWTKRRPGDKGHTRGAGA